MRRRAALTGTAVLAAAAGPAAHAPAELSVRGGYMPQPILADVATVYFTITNSGGSAAELTSVTTPLAEDVTLHTTTGTTMEQVGSLTVVAGGRLTLGVGGNRLMLEKLTHKPPVGDKVTLNLHFAHASPTTLTVTVPVRPPTYRPEDRTDPSPATSGMPPIVHAD